MAAEPGALGDPGPGGPTRATDPRAGARDALRERLRLLIVTRPRPACGRPLPEVVARCVEAGATAVELRDEEADGRLLFRVAESLRRVLEGTGALFLVNDRPDVALAAGADGAHLGPEDLPIEAARRVVPPSFVLGYSTDDPREARRAAAAGADYLGVGAVYGTRSKAGLADEVIGPERVAEVLEAAGLPGVGIGGIRPENAAAVARAGAGVAVLGAVMDAPRPAAAVRELLAALGG